MHVYIRIIYIIYILYMCVYVYKYINCLSFASNDDRNILIQNENIIFTKQMHFTFLLYSPHY